MAEGPPKDEDVLWQIEQIRARSVESVRDPVVRQVERRVYDRRGLGFTARREEDAHKNRQSRAFLSSYLRRLPPETLWLWIDGFWLGQATDAQLAALVNAVQEFEQVVLGRKPPRPGRPRVDTIAGVHPASLRHEWRLLTPQFKAFALLRHQHHARMNRTRSGPPRSLAHREGCLTSPLGQRVDQAGLFAEFFDVPRRRDRGRPPLIPGEMAARLLHHETRAHLTAVEANARAQAAKARSRQSRDMWAARATKAAAAVKELPSWKTMYNELRKKPLRQSPPTSSRR